MATKNWVNIGSGNGLASDSKPLPEPMLIIISDTHMKAISQGIPQPLITKIKICLQITYLRFHLNFLMISCWSSTIYFDDYHQTFSIRPTKSQCLTVSHLVLQLSLPNPLKTGVKWRLKMQLKQRQEAMLQLYRSDQQAYRQLRCLILDVWW